MKRDAKRSANNPVTQKRKGPIQPGPGSLLPPAAASLTDRFPVPGEGWLEGDIVSDDVLIPHIAERILTGRNPTFFPGPLLLWGWTEATRIRAAAALELVGAIPGINVIPMPDYRPIYPKIDPEALINPCHPNLTLWHNKIEVGLFMDAHCHFVNVMMKMIRAGTNCYTIALCANDTHEDAIASLGWVDLAKLAKLRDAIVALRDSGKVIPWARTAAGKAELALRKDRKAETKKQLDHYLSGLEHELVVGLDEHAE